ncbi:hypothetical protein HNY73_022933 [Argiope bruennichi]|uniref:Uncharacterized protein n=1 Tax=Argiope bruennichi TaxID=94029 RepID=A0A8T0E2I7_ARGBR|nr:hypothetical protein HNY73_022933 [Argiope bruennichi]
MLHQSGPNVFLKCGRKRYFAKFESVEDFSVTYLCCPQDRWDIRRRLRQRIGVLRSIYTSESCRWGTMLGGDIYVCGGGQHKRIN